MKKVLLGVIIGILLTLVSFILFNLFEHYKFEHSLRTIVSRSVEASFNNVFPAAEIKEIGIEPAEEHHKVNYLHDKLFKITVDYKSDGKYKTISFLVGTYKKHIIGPPEIELLKLNDNATLLYEE